MNPMTRNLPKAKTTALGLDVATAEAYAMWQAGQEGVKILDVRTPEEHRFVGHPVAQRCGEPLINTRMRGQS